MGKKGHGCIYQQDGRYYFQMRINGKRKLVALKASTHEAADAEADEYRRLWAAKSIDELGHFIATAKNMIQKSLPLESVWTRYEAEPSRPDSGASTLANYKYQWGNFLLWLQEHHPDIKRLDQITEDAAKDYARHLWSVRKLSSSTFNQHIKTLRLIARIAGRNSLRSNPWDYIKLKTEVKQRRKDFTPSEVEQLLEWFNGDGHIRDKAELRTLFYVGAHTGLRLESAIRLAWSNIDLANGRITCMPSKTWRIQRTVNIPLHPRLRAELESLPSRAGDLMPSLKARYSRASEGKVSEDIIKVIDACGFIGRSRAEDEAGRGINRRLYGYHSFRHAYASTCANAGVPITTLADILGDSIATLQKYYMHTQEDMREKVFAALTPDNEKAKLIAEISAKLQAATPEKLREIQALL